MRFDYKVQGISDMPLVISPHILKLGNPFFTRQALYFLEDVESVIRMLVPASSDTPGNQEMVHESLASFQRAADDCLFHYSLCHFDSRLTTRSDRKISPEHTTKRVFIEHTETGDRYEVIDNGSAGLKPNAIQEFEDIYAFYLGLVHSEVENPDEIEEAISSWPMLPLGYTCLKPLEFYRTPYTFQELALVSRLIPIDPRLIDRGFQLAKHAFARERHIGILNQPYREEVERFPPEKWLTQEIIKTDTTYNPILLDFYFAGLSSLSPIVEFRNYYSVVEYFFEDATFSNLQRNLQDNLDAVRLAGSLKDYKEQLKRLQPAPTEREQICEVIAKYVGKDQLAAFFNEKVAPEAKRHFESYSARVGDKSVDRIDVNHPKISGVADRIYQFRNAIFHSKRIKDGKKIQHFRPGTPEESSVVQYEALLLRFVAQEIITQAEVDI